MATAPAPGSAFNVPGIPGGSTQWFEEYEDTYDLSFTPSSSTSKPVLGIQKFRQTDVVAHWEAQIVVKQKVTAGTGQTVVGSKYAPWNYVGPVRVLVQNQYSAIDVESGIDAYIADLIRPFRRTAVRNIAGANPAGFPAGGSATGYPSPTNAQANLDWPRQWKYTLDDTFVLVLGLGPAVWFDSYYDLGITGSPASPPHSALVSPQFMAGTTRVITPQLTANQVLSTSTTDIAPVHTTDKTTTGDTATTATCPWTVSFRRHGVYAGNPAVNPVVYAWQHRIKTDRLNTIQGSSRAKIEIPLDTGQIMSTYLRLFDPKATTTKGAPIAITKVSKVEFQYGSGLLRFSGTPAELQRRFLAQHGVLPPPGVLALDFATNERGQVTNHNLPNTLTTGGILWSVEFTGAQSSEAYAVLGTESLVYVT